MDLIEILGDCVYILLLVFLGYKVSLGAFKDISSSTPKMSYRLSCGYNILGYRLMIGTLHNQ